MDKDLVPLAAEARRQGWEVELLPGGHVGWRCPSCAGMVTSHSSGTGRRAVANHVSRLRRHAFTWQGRPANHTAELHKVVTR